MNPDFVTAAQQNLHSGDSPWVFAALALVIVPVFVSAGVYMVWRPEEFIRRSRLLKAADQPMMPGAVGGTRLFGAVVLAFMVFWTGGVIIAVFS